MGKGSRARTKRLQEHPAYELPLKQAAKLEKAVRILCTLSGILTLVSLLMPSWSLFIISQNLTAEQYTADEIAALTPALPLGTLSLILIAIGVIVTCVLLRMRKPALSLIGLGVCGAANAMLVSFAVTIGEVFAFNPILHSGHGQGLDFWDLVLRYYILLVPTAMLIVAICMGFRAHKKRDVADMMKNASDTSSTLSLDEDETTQNKE